MEKEKHCKDCLFWHRLMYTEDGACAKGNGICSPDAGCGAFALGPQENDINAGPFSVISHRDGFATVVNTYYGCVAEGLPLRSARAMAMALNESCRCWAARKEKLAPEKPREEPWQLTATGTETPFFAQLFEDAGELLTGFLNKLLDGLLLKLEQKEIERLAVTPHTCYSCGLTFLPSSGERHWTLCAVRNGYDGCARWVKKPEDRG